MPSRETSDQRIEYELAKQRDDVEVAIERGGLPTETEVNALSDTLSVLHDELEGITWRVEGIAESATGDDLPSIISLEELGVLTVMLTDLELRFEESSRLKRRIEKQLFSLTAIRNEQVRAAAEV